MKKDKMNNKGSDIRELKLLKHSDKLISLTVLVMLINSLFIPIFIQDSFSIVVSLGIVLSMLLVVFARADYIEKMRPSKIFYALIFIIGLSFLLNGLYFRVLGYIAIAVVFLLVVPALNRYFLSGNTEKIYSAVSKGVIASFVFVLIVSVFMGPVLTVRQYASLFGNPNLLGNFNIIVTSAVLYQLLRNSENRKRLTLTIIFFLNISMCIFSNSRTSMIAIVLQSLIYLCIIFRTAFTEDKTKVWIKNGLIAILIAVVSFCSLFYLLSNEKIKVIEFESSSLSLKESLELSKTRFSKGLDGKNENDAFTSGRLGIWNEYMHDTGVIGHKKESKDIVNGSRVYKDTNAHNVYLQIAYSAGVIAGCTCFVFALYVFGKSVLYFIFCMRNKKMNREVIYSIFAAVGFGIASLTSAGYLMFTYLPSTVFWMTSGLLFTERSKSL